MGEKRRNRLEKCDVVLARRIKAAIESELGLHEVADVSFDYDDIEEGFLHIHVDFYDDPVDN